MKRILVVAAASLLASAAYAADAIVYEPAPAPIYDAPGFSWTGFYVGINGGYGGGKARGTGTATIDYLGTQSVPDGPLDSDFSVGQWVDGVPGIYDVGSLGLGITGSGFLGGVQAGYNWQSGSMILGIETDIQATNITAEASASLSIANWLPLVGGEAWTGAIGAEIDWFGTTRLRVGFTPVERFMVYATGGLAYGKMSGYAELANLNVPGSGVSASASKTKLGWTVGAGAEYAINNNWSLKSEYLYTDLGKWTLFDETFAFTDGTLNLAGSADFRFHTVRVGLNYRF